MDTIRVEVAYGHAGAQRIIALTVYPGTTAKQAVERSGMVRFFPEIDMNALDLGIFSQGCTPDTVLRDGDRVEIYRPLLCDPKEMRRQRARKHKE
ncbi:MAG: RnfH family protein [Cardiobacteriaceae bacterium]|nr:RnfH family protein [Cardiobacteriaceae bacterium]